MESRKVIEIEEIKKENQTTRCWGPCPPPPLREGAVDSHPGDSQDDSTRCWGPCPPPPLREGEELEELEIT
jgi:hypothetical protein